MEGEDHGVGEGAHNVDNERKPNVEVGDGCSGTAEKGNAAASKDSTADSTQDAQLKTETSLTTSVDIADKNNSISPHTDTKPNDSASCQTELSSQASDSSKNDVVPLQVAAVIHQMTNNGSLGASSPETPLTLLSLPTDSLHCIASFLDAPDWANFGQGCAASNRICVDVFRKVRMHGFRCATEVVTAWKLGQHADARELSALYIKSGVPIYPYSLGHSYHTLVWRLGAEAKEIERSQSDPSDANRSSATVDPFYSARIEARANEPNETQNHSFLKEKCLYWLAQDGRGDTRTQRIISLSRRGRLVPPPAAGAGENGGRPTTPRPLVPGSPRDLESLSPEANALTGGVHYDSQTHAPKATVKIHRHLVDQHLAGRASVNDENGAMKTQPLSLSADFYHPRLPSHSISGSLVGVASLNELSFERHSSIGLEPSMNPLVENRAAMLPSLGGADNGSQQPQARDDVDQLGQTLFPLEPSLETPPHPTLFQVLSDTNPTPPSTSANISLDAENEADDSVLKDIDLDIFCAESTKLNTVGLDEFKSHLRNRFSVYERRLDTLLSESDSAGFEECVLDFWDEFLPVTANIHFFDKHTAVPRISGLQKFLTKPCSKAIGIVQCEIQRIKITSKNKGVNMKGRLFPTYEYRLFIRDRRHSSTPESVANDDREPERKDTVLMMAKNRGRKHQDPSGVVLSPSSSKKGVNNYYLYMPLQVDVNNHFASVNNGKEISFTPNGACALPSPAETAPMLLGRLQSNFIGTEFQIFTPSLQKRPPRKPNARPSQALSSDSESEAEYDSGFSSDNPSSAPTARRTNRFIRRSHSRPARRGRESIGDTPQPIEEESSRSPSPDRRRMRRSYSLPVLSYRRTSRNSRRAVANSVDSPENQQYQTVLWEEEDGAITYTANLLGNRPRIMDVCIPRVSPEGVAGVEWKRYLDSVDDANDGTNRMLSHFKQLQQRLENPQQNEADNHLGENNQGGDREGDGDYSPPDDFGLLALQNRPPWWNIELGAFVLNFGGRVSVASVKNFQLCDRNDQDYIMLQFGRIQGRHSFTMDFQYPLSAVQAFAIAISSLQSRISFG